MRRQKRSSPLLAKHESLGAKMTEFGGWLMPLQYAGVIAEHTAVRSSAGIFDVSHLGKLRMSGAAAGDALQRAVTADVTALEEGGAVYALVLAEDAGCIDDVFCYRIAPEEWLVVPNAANTDAVLEAIEDCGGSPRDEWDRWGILAVQGPESIDVFERVFPSSGASELELHRWLALDVMGDEGMFARTGYTGERGIELYAPWSVATAAFEALTEAGATPAGLGARDTLRLEMGFALYGHELHRDGNPLEAGLEWAVAWDTPFRGRQALEKIKKEGPSKRLFGITCKDRGVPRQGHKVEGSSHDEVGTVVSGNYSPTLGTGIAMAYGRTKVTPGLGESVHVIAKSRRIEGTVVRPPFIAKR